MTEQAPVPDGEDRRRALDPESSFIVQAPAGSGKTELLVQRYLSLLPRVRHPEEIVAITFTNKAAGEMRGRVLAALHGALAPAPEAPHARTTWVLARSVLAQDRRRAWDLAANPGRLRVRTIDALCASLTGQMPWLSRFGAQPVVSDDPGELYRQAARRTVAELETGAGWSRSVARLLTHLDNDLPRLESLLAAMLARRDQWLRHVVGVSDRACLERGLERAVAEAVGELRAAFPRAQTGAICALASYGAENLRQAGAESPLRVWDTRMSLPGADADDLPGWLGLAELLLTSAGEWRKAVNARVGFPAPSSTRDPIERNRRQQAKTRLTALLEELAQQEGLRTRLDGVRRLPPTAYSDGQWVLIEALIELLTLAAGQLRLVFREQGAVDFSAISQAALEALGSPEQPTDLALALDYRVQHLLVDEFQDTSQSQFELLERLTAGWEPGDGRTLFLVGDPMQSIYRFREAEVGLYLRAWREGIGQVPLIPLGLRVNFRSQQGIVDWVNSTFARVFPATDEVSTGAVAYVDSVAVQRPLAGPAVQVHPALGNDPRVEAQQVAALVRRAREADPEGRVAILVRSRGHLAYIVPRLKREGLPFRAIDIEPLGHRQPVQDLLALTRALLHGADRTAWLALLRAPWCGLGLADLVALAGEDHHAALWDLMQDSSRLAGLTQSGRIRLERVRGLLAESLANRGRRSLRRWVEGTWLALGGPACLEGETDLADAQVYFEMLEQVDEAGDMTDPMRLAEAVADLFSPPDSSAGEQLQIMTMHKAKGLEFDTVILPGLGRRPRCDSQRLLFWLERPGGDAGESELLLAPIRGGGEQSESIYDFLSELDRRKQAHEDRRLLYVAVTRARKRLHLLGHVERGAAGETDARLRSPASGSLLALLWPVLEQVYEDHRDALPGGVPEDGGDAALTPLPNLGIHRLPGNWQAPPVPEPVAWERSRPPAVEGGAEVEFLWARETVRHVGSVVHRVLQLIAEDGPAAWDRARVAGLAAFFRAALAREGVPPRQLETAATRVVEALVNTLEDVRGRWILEGHGQARTEYALSGLRGARVVHLVIDRTFVDADGRRWIIDYKVSSHEGGDREAFLDAEQARYRAQLQTYAEIMYRLDPRPIRLGLYFPLLGGWREWDWLPDAREDG